VYGSGGVEMTRKQVYNLEFTNQYIMLVINTNDGTEVYKVNTNAVNYQIRSMFQIKYGTYDNEFGSFQRLAVQMKLAGQTVWNDIQFKDINGNPLTDRPCDISRQQSSQSNDNLAVLLYATMAFDANKIKYSIACDDPLNQGFGFIEGSPAGSFGVHTSKSANIPRLMTVLVDNVDATNDNKVSHTVMQYMVDAQNNAGMFQNTDIMTQQILDENPTADCLTFDATTGIGIQTTNASHETGIESQDDIITSGIDYPLFYVSIPSLPIRNYSASDSHGTENQFVCAVELEQSQSSSFYTSKIYTEQYNVLQNAQDIEIDRIHIRICDIDSVAVEALKQYTTLVLEIKDDPRLEQQLFFNNLKDYIERRETVPQVIDYQ
jgi:hypothetical protein